MPSKLYSVELLGLEACLVEIEVDKLGGIPTFTIVGLPDAAVKEASERVRSAIKNSNLFYPRNKIVVNLAPADLRKIGPRYDLAIALGILGLEDLIDPQLFKDTIIIGELALNGKVRPVNGILSSVDFAKKTGFTRVLVPAENAREAALIHGVKILPAHTLQEALLHIQKKLEPLPIRNQIDSAPEKSDIDMDAIYGQHQAKRALEVAAAGGHNLLMVGPPGAGKTLLARALAGILPSMSEEEMLEISKIYSIVGLLPKTQPLITKRPFRSIHHTASAVSIVGGGNVPNPGEVSLANRGVLFMDEIAEFPTFVLDVLRQPIENKCVTVSRARGSFTYPAQFTLIAAMNPCPCGYFNKNENARRAHPCTCTSRQIKNYQKRLSGPLLDRIDMYLNVEPVPQEQLIEKTRGENSKDIQKRVEVAVKIQRKRFFHQNIKFNSEMQNRDLEKHCKLCPEGQDQLITAINQLGLSARGYHRILKLARTIADLAQEKSIQKYHITEALQFRSKLFDI